MSTLQATNLKHGSSASNNLVLDANGNVTAAGTVAMATPFAMRNKIINGAMEIDQRNNGASVTVGPSAATSIYTVDRWCGFASSTRTFTAQRSSTAPSGFINSELLTVGVSGSPSAAEQIFFNQSIEGLNVADLGFGTASAQAVTVSFWVRSSITGTYGFGLSNSDGSRTYPSTYTINAANTWEKKTITISGDTAGTWLVNNGIGLIVRFDLGSGSNFNGTANTWSGGYHWRTSSCVNWISNAGATFYITGVQLEVGSVATPFERRLYGTEEFLCKRYFQWVPFTIGFLATSSSSFLQFSQPLVPQMRAVPSFSAIVADPNSTQATTNNSSNVFGAAYSSVNAAFASLQAITSGNCQVLGYRSQASSEL